MKELKRKLKRALTPYHIATTICLIVLITSLCIILKPETKKTPSGITVVSSKTKENEEITEEELIRRIIEYKSYKEITKKLKENFIQYSKRFYKTAEEIKLPKQKIEKKYDDTIIPEIYKSIIQKNSEKINENAANIEKIAITETYSVGDTVKQMYRSLLRFKKFTFNKLFSLKKHDKREVVTAFSGLLEMSRRNKVITEQEKLFGDIEVEKSRNKNIID